MLISLTVVVTYISNHDTVYLKYATSFIKSTSVHQGAKESNVKKEYVNIPKSGTC